MNFLIVWQHTPTDTSGAFEEYSDKAGITARILIAMASMQYVIIGFLKSNDFGSCSPANFAIEYSVLDRKWGS
jgi:hypothetical protein